MSPHVVPTDELIEGLETAVDLGVIESFTAGRIESARDNRTLVRFFEVVFSDGDKVRWGPGAVDAFSTGVRETARVLGVSL